MNNQNDSVVDILLKREQAERRAKARQQREKKRKEDIEVCKYIMIGRLFTQYFPKFFQFKLQNTKSANDIELEPMRMFLSVLSNDTGYMEKLMAMPRLNQVIELLLFPRHLQSY